MTRGPRRFGKARVAGCQCDYRYTCGPCMQAAAERNQAEQSRQPPAPERSK